MRKRQFRAKVHLNDEEFTKLTEQVKQSNLSREAYLRALVARNTPRGTAHIDYQRFKQEFHVIGVNMNRIAVHANATGFFLVDEYEDNLNRLKKLITELSALVTAPAEQTKESEEQTR